jgi:hypothetical protein
VDEVDGDVADLDVQVEWEAVHVRLRRGIGVLEPPCDGLLPELVVVRGYIGPAAIAEVAGDRAASLP